VNCSLFLNIFNLHFITTTCRSDLLILHFSLSLEVLSSLKGRGSPKVIAVKRQNSKWRFYISFWSFGWLYLHAFIFTLFLLQVVKDNKPWLMIRMTTETRLRIFHATDDNFTEDESPVQRPQSTNNNTGRHLKLLPTGIALTVISLSDWILHLIFNDNRRRMDTNCPQSHTSFGNNNRFIRIPSVPWSRDRSN